MSATEVGAWACLLVLLAAIGTIDFRTRRIPNGLNALLLATGLAAAALGIEPGLPAALAGAVLGATFLLAVAVTFRRLRGREGLGLGDVKFLAGAGAWVGWQGIGPLVFLAAVTALLVLAMRRLAGHTLDRRAPIPFGPFLCVALLGVRVMQVTVPGLWT